MFAIFLGMGHVDLEEGQFLGSESGKARIEGAGAKRAGEDQDFRARH
jgi:hypothetical protein